MVEGWNAYLIWCQERERLSQYSAVAALTLFGGKDFHATRFVRLDSIEDTELL